MGNPVGPARVWLKHENIPGLAMARSIGDRIAAQVGVIAEPGKIYLILIIVMFFYRNKGI